MQNFSQICSWFAWIREDGNFYYKKKNQLHRTKAVRSSVQGLSIICMITVSKGMFHVMLACKWKYT